MSVDDEDVEIPLIGDGVTAGIVRVGDTVRRPVRPFTSAVHDFLRHLHSQGFDAAPRPLGYDGEGREILSFVVGEVPREPLPDWATTDQVLGELALLVRREHDAAQSWPIPSGVVWGRLPGHPVVGLMPVFDTPELVAHMDYCPGNVVFRDGMPTALIDFDLARPTTRVNDVVNALHWWAPLRHPVDRAPSLVDMDIAERVSLFADAYGLDREQRRSLMPCAVARAHNSALTFEAAARTDEAFRRMWDEGVRDLLPRTRAWTAASEQRITERLLGA